jgi:endonuclease YncB( thermonuclease family)
MAASKKIKPSASKPYRVITGQFHLYYTTPAGKHQGFEPDGDTIRFKPDRGITAFKDIEKDAVPGGAVAPGTKKPRPVEFNAAGMCSLRFEAIDAIELHFQGEFQDDRLAKAARDHMLRKAGFKSAEFSGERLTFGKVAQPHPVDGYLITRGVDPNGRVISFVYAGAPAEADGSATFLTTTRVRSSINASILNAGHAYPTFYTGLPTDLRKTMASLGRKARKPAKGIWKQPNPRAPFKATNLQALATSKIWPKLFRRLVSYFKATGGPLAGFDAWLRSGGEDDMLFILARGELGNLHDAVKVANGKISLRYDSDELIIVPK